MDVRLPDGSGVEACREIRSDHPETRVVMLTSYPDEEAVLSAIVAGASGYLLKETRLRDLVKALETVGAGGSLLDPAVTGKVLDRVRRMANDDDDDELARLTSQERRILLLVAEGKTNREIAAEVFLSDKTVKNYVSSICPKLDLQRRTQAAHTWPAGLARRPSVSRRDRHRCAGEAAQELPPTVVDQVVRLALG